jgi:hypothetical protein
MVGQLEAPMRSISRAAATTFEATIIDPRKEAAYCRSAGVFLIGDGASKVGAGATDEKGEPRIARQGSEPVEVVGDRENGLSIGIFAADGESNHRQQPIS